MPATCTLPSHRARPAGRPFAAAFHSLVSLAATHFRGISRALKNRRQAGLLAHMDDRMLSDIGLTRSDLRDAYAEPLWRDPTEVLAGRVGERRRSRRLAAVVTAPPLAPDGDLAARADRPARHPT